MSEAGPAVLLRPAGARDLAAVVAVHLASRRQAERTGSMPSGIHPETEVRAWLGARLATDEVWVAEVDGEVAAYARMTDEWLDDLYVAPEHAREGLGSALLDLVKAQRVRGFCLWVFTSNQQARAFYRHHGLVELEQTDGSANEERSPDVRMAWPGEQPLAFFRSLIDDVDGQFADLLARRVALTGAVQEHKQGVGRDPDRERAIAEAMALRAPAFGADRLARIVDLIITESLAAAGEG